MTATNALTRLADQPALEWAGTTYTFNELEQRSNRAAHALRERGLERGDRLRGDSAALVMNSVRSSGPPKATLVMFDVGSAMRASSRPSSLAWQVTQPPPQCAIHSRPSRSVVMPSG